MNFEKVVLIENQEQVLYSLYTEEDDIGIIVDLYIYNELYEPGYYTHAFQVLKDLEPDDNINIYINSPGGCLDTLLAFEQALNNTEANITCYVTGEAASAAGILAFLGDNLVLSDFATVMLHNVQTTTDGDSSDISKSILNTANIYKQLLERYCSIVLSDVDITDIIDNGKTFYFTSETLSPTNQPVVSKPVSEPPVEVPPADSSTEQPQVLVKANVKKAKNRVKKK